MKQKKNENEKKIETDRKVEKKHEQVQTATKYTLLDCEIDANCRNKKKAPALAKIKWKKAEMSKK